MIFASTPESLMCQLKITASTIERKQNVVRIPCNYNGKTQDVRLWLVGEAAYYGIDIDDFRYICGEDWDTVEARYENSIIS